MDRPRVVFVHFAFRRETLFVHKNAHADLLCFGKVLIPADEFTRDHIFSIPFSPLREVFSLLYMNRAEKKSQPLSCKKFAFDPKKESLACAFSAFGVQ